MVFTFSNKVFGTTIVPLDGINNFSGLIVSKVDGLGPPDATLNTTATVNMHGSKMTSSNLGARLITFTFIFDENFDYVERSRRRLYKVFPMMEEVTFRLESDEFVAQIEGVVKSVTPDIFDSQTGAVVMLECHNPLFYNPESSLIEFSGVSPAFEFPFSNESLTKDLIEFGVLDRTIMKSIFYYGDIETPVLFKIHVTGTVKNIVLARMNTQEYINLDTDKLYAMLGTYFETGDELLINTGINNEITAYLLRGGVMINILNIIERGSTWMQMNIGENVFAFDAEVGVEMMLFEIVYNTLYLGV